MAKRTLAFEKVDVRVRMLVMILVSVSALMLKTETALLLCLIFMWLWLIPFGCVRKALRCTVAYGALYGLLFMMKGADMLGNLPLLTVYTRRLMLLVMAAAPVINAPTGCLIAALNKMKIPRAATLSLTVMFRFMPTLSEEYRHIRESQKIRGIGASLTGVLRHPLQTAECMVLMKDGKIAGVYTRKEHLCQQAHSQRAKQKGGFRYSQIAFQHEVHIRNGDRYIDRKTPYREWDKCKYDGH